VNPRLESLAPFPTDDHDPGRERFVLLKGTRQVFLASDELFALVADARIDDAGAVVRESRIEAERLAGLGFLGGERVAPIDAASSRILCLHLAHGCNLACRYCNVGQGTYGDDLTLMTTEVADAAFEMLEQQERVRPGSPPMLMLFGGEPLLNWPVLEHVTRRFRKRYPAPPADVWLVTNATLLTADRARLLRDLDVFTLVSLDGPPEYHDAMRPFVRGGGSHAATLRGLRHLEDAEVRHVIRSTWKPGCGAREELLTYLRATARKALQVTVSADFSSSADGVAAYGESVRREWQAFEDSGYRTHAPASSAIIIDHVLRADWAPVRGCPAGDTGLSITPSGDIHPCQVSVARKLAPLGNVLQGAVGSTPTAETRTRLHLDDRGPACADCLEAPFCGGPCLFLRPLHQRQQHCDTQRMELIHSFRYAARQPVAELVGRYRLGLVTERDVRALQRGAALRNIAWSLNRHLRPLALCPNAGAK